MANGTIAASQLEMLTQSGTGIITIVPPNTNTNRTLTLPDATGTVLSTASTTGISGSAISSGTVPEAYGGTGTSTGYYGFKNRIINGAMVIDQRNAGAAITANGYSVDRFDYANFTDGAFSVQQDTTVPAGFIKSLKVTVTSPDASVTTNQSAFISQKIEGLNCADLGWGAAGAQSVTFSFWVRSSLTGTFGGSFRNNATDRSYPYSYTISAANTWEQKTITIAGDTTGTWLTTNGVGINISFSLAAGPSVVGTANVWAAANYVSASSTTNVVSTNGATWAITGVQLEKGSTATSFDYRDIGRELIMCQRYFERSYNIGSATGSFTNGFIGFNTPLTATGDIPTNILFKVTKRDTPTVVVYNAVSGASGAAYRASDGSSISVTGINYVGTNGVGNLSLASGSVNNYLIHYTASSEL